MGKKRTTKPIIRKPRKTSIEKPYSDGTMSKAMFFSMIRAALRQKSRWFLPVKNCRDRNKVPYVGTNKRRKWSYKCEECGLLFEGTETRVHHKIECGSLNCFEDVAGFAERLFCNSEHLKLVCNKCHDKEHKK